MAIFAFDSFSVASALRFALSSFFILLGHGIPSKETDIGLHRRAEFKFPALHGVQYAVLGQLLHPSGADSKHSGKLSRGNIFVRNFFSRSHLKINSFLRVQSG